MLEVKQKEIREYDTKAGREMLNERLKAWQTEHNTTGVPAAYHLGLRCIAKSYGVYGCNGVLYIDTLHPENGCMYGIANRDGCWIYID